MIELDIFFNNQEQNELDKLGIGETNIEDSVVRKTMFYKIDTIHPYKDKYTMIYSSGEIFICPMEYDKLKELLNKNT